MVLGGDEQFGQKSENIVLSPTESLWGFLRSACEHKSDTYKATIATTSRKWSNSGEFSLVAVRELLYFCVIEIGFAQGAICLIAVSL